MSMRGFGGGGGGRMHFHYDKGDMPKPKITWKLLKRIFTYFTPYLHILSLIILAVVSTSWLGLLPPMFTRDIIDTALPGKDLPLLVRLTLLSFGVTVLTGLISVAESYLNNRMSKSIIFDIRNLMYKHLGQMSLRFYSNVQTGEIISRMNNDIGGIESVFSGTVMNILQNAFVFVITAVALFRTNWKLALIGMLVLPLFVLPTKKVGRVRFNIAKDTQQQLAKLNNIIQETLNVSGTMLVKIFTKENDEYERFRDINKEVIRLQIKESLAGRWFFMVMRIFTSIGPMLIYLAGGYLLIKNDEVSIGSIVLFVTLLGRLYGPISTFSNIHVDITRSLALFERIFNYFDMPVEIQDAADAVDIPETKGEIVFRDVSFSYNKEQETLKNVNLTIHSGEMAALVGPSGAGKTTITYLVPRLYDATSGEITLDGLPLTKITLESLRSQIGFVTQDTYLFNASIRENLLFAKADATDAEIESACRAAYIHDMIVSTPNGYETVVGDRGIKLSGGEKQRLSIARTILKNPRIVILDEATSSLDSVSEALIQKAMEPLLRGRTSLVIAHRLSTIVAADQIFVVQNGEIAERGTHQTLLEAGGIYKELCERQFKGAEEMLMTLESSV